MSLLLSAQVVFKATRDGRNFSISRNVFRVFPELNPDPRILCLTIKKISIRGTLMNFTPTRNISRVDFLMMMKIYRAFRGRRFLFLNFRTSRVVVRAAQDDHAVGKFMKIWSLGFLVLRNHISDGSWHEERK